ncbi:MAG: chorismate synthase, partial [Clostridiales bacterium]|nr:chorismate synthase [Clostridiales bacterium]
MAIKYVTAGESHGRALVGILENMPAGLEIDFDFVNAELKRRMSGFGRGERMALENDTARFLTGVVSGRTIGSPITIAIDNADCRYESDKPCEQDKLTAVRAGHADLSGAVKYGFSDARNISERASARSTAVTVALGAVAKLYLKCLGIEIGSHTVAIGSVKANYDTEYFGLNARADGNAVRCLDVAASKKMTEEITRAKRDGDSLGGVSEIIVTGCKSGIGSYVSADKRLDGLIMRAVGCVPSVKAVEIGDGISGSGLTGSQFHDEIYP